MHSKKSMRHLVIGLTAVAALTLTACGSDETQFEDTATADSTQEQVAVEEEMRPELPEAERGLVHHDISQEPTILDTFTPEHAEVVTPAGTLTVDKVEVVESVSAGELEMSSYDAQEQVGPAAGEELMILDLSFQPDEATQGYGGLDASADLALEAAGQRNHIDALDSQETYRMLISAPQDSSTQFVIASEGHDQRIDVLTGERIVDPQDPAAAYYREVTVQDLNHAFQIDDRNIAVSTVRGSDEIPLSQDPRINTVTLTAWTEESGWADEGQAWLLVDWELELDGHSGATRRVLVEDVDMTLKVDLGGETLTDNVKDPADKARFSHEQISSFEVDNEISELILSFDIGIGSLEGSINVDVVGDEATGYEFSTDDLEVEFPMNGTNSQPSSDESDEPTDEPTDE